MGILAQAECETRVAKTHLHARERIAKYVESCNEKAFSLCLYINTAATAPITTTTTTSTTTPLATF